MRLYISTFITGSLLIYLASNLSPITPPLGYLHSTAQYTPIHLADNKGQPSHRGSGRKELLSYSDFITASAGSWE